jgi:hypothetical protein
VNISGAQPVTQFRECAQFIEVPIHSVGCKVLALAQARKVDVILVTELIRWGRSARFAARSYRQNPNLLRLGANVDLRLDAIGRHFEREIERVDALLELKGAVNQRFQIDFARAHEGQGTRVDVCVTKHRFD